MCVEQSIINNVGLIVVDNPPVNAISGAVADGITSAVKELESREDVRAILLTATGRTFVAGADVKNFERLIDEGSSIKEAGFYEVTNTLENCHKPVTCALFGSTFGGGLELAMACHYRVALAGSLIGQPEVKLGLIPGAGGTQRLPRLCGIENAATMCAFGEPVTVEQGKEWGIIDELFDDQLQDRALEFALRVSNEPPRRTSDLTIHQPSDEKTKKALERTRQLSNEKYQGAKACGLAIDAVEKSLELPLEDGLTIENDLFLQAFNDEEAKTLIKLFFAERAAPKVDGIDLKKFDQAPAKIVFYEIRPSDVALVTELIRAQIPLEIYHKKTQWGPNDVLAIHATPQFDGLSELTELNTNLLILDDQFDHDRWVAAGFDRRKMIGLKLNRTGSNLFGELAATAETDPETIAGAVNLLKKIRVAFVFERPNPEYVSTRIQDHRFDLDDLKIEAWKLVNEKIVQRVSDIDVVLVNCFGHPRHQANIGWNMESTRA